MANTGRILFGAGLAAAVAALAFGYVPPAGTVTKDVIAAVSTNVLKETGWDYVPAKRGYGVVRGVKYTSFTAKPSTNEERGVVSSLIAMYADCTRATSDGVYVHSDAQLTNAIGIIHR